MVRWRVGIDYFPFFFLVGLAADFAPLFALAFFAGAFAFAVALAFFAGAFSAFAVFLAAAFVVGAASTFTFFDVFSRFGASSFSATGASVWPIAVASINTTSDQSR